MRYRSIMETRQFADDVSRSVGTRESTLRNPYDVMSDSVPPSTPAEYSNRPLTTEDLYGNTQPDPMQTLLQTFADNSRNIEKALRMTSEKEALDEVKLQSLKTEDLIEFKSRAKRDSCKPIWHQVPAKLRRPLAFDLGAESLEAFCGSNDTKFLLALQKLIDDRNDVDPLKLLRLKTMPDSITSLDRSAVTVMLSSCCDLVEANRSLFAYVSEAEIKMILVDNLRPIYLRDSVKEFQFRIVGEHFKLLHLIQLINKTYQELTTAMQFGRIIPGSQLLVNSVQQETRGNRRQCWNCKEPHPIADCKVKCRVHKKHCPDIKKCLYANQKAERATAAAATTTAAAKKTTGKRANAAVVAATTVPGDADDDTDTEVPNLPLVASSVQSDHLSSSNQKDILIDSGANVLCLNRREYFDSLDESSKATTDSILVADGSPSVIQGTGYIADQPAKYIPGFNSSLVPASILTNNAVAVFTDDKLHVLADIPSTRAAISDIIKESDRKHSTLLNVARVNGLYSIDIDQLQTLCRSRDFQVHHDQANSSYFTVKLDNLGEIVRYWHLAWKHASKKDMVRIVKHQIFDDIPKELTAKVINKYFDDHRMGCKRSTMS